MKHDTSTPVGLLKKARSEFKKHAWNKNSYCKGEAQNPEAMCAGGAINFASTGNARRPPVLRENFNTYREALNVLHKVIESKGYGDNIAAYNDEIAKYKKDVVAIFDEAIEQLELR